MKKAARKAAYFIVAGRLDGDRRQVRLEGQDARRARARRAAPRAARRVAARKAATILVSQPRQAAARKAAFCIVAGRLGDSLDRFDSKGETRVRFDSPRTVERATDAAEGLDAID
jgi:hypothetical protein